MSTATPNPRVAVFALGGTIAMTATDAGGVAPSLTAEDLVAAVPGLDATGIVVDVVQFRQLPGASLSFTDVQALSDEISSQPRSMSGFVVTQGTDTIEETAYLLDLLYAGDRPVVVTGAMRNPTLAGADGPANLLAAVQTAAAPTVRGLGCLVAMDDTIHSARQVRKTHSTATSTFVSVHSGPVGYVVEGQPRVVNSTGRRLVVPTKLADDLRIPLYTATLGDDDVSLRAVSEGAAGLIVAGMGVGHVPMKIAAALDGLATRMPVVLTSRTGSGPVLRSTYGFQGSERDLISRGLIPAGYLDPLKARILLATLVSGGHDMEAIRRAFAVAGGYEDAEMWPWPATSEEGN
ncbi:asparaginase [Nocardia kruczakiae]|uniref:asparaginase n=1 Tax=Nocardia kruczakiae TaxID=261477 RepID=UPI001C3FCBB4|nr:asparaginase [Nocardia kruczakiae]